jgi:hypothetical protein
MSQVPNLIVYATSVVNSAQNRVTIKTEVVAGSITTSGFQIKTTKTG